MRPVVSDLTERIYALMEPLHAQDADNDYGMLILCSAAAAMMEQAFGWVGGEDGTEPWQHLLDTADLDPGAGLTLNEYLAQILGLAVRVMEPSLALAIMDQKLAHMRGTVAYLEAVMLWALGVDSIGVYERVDDTFTPDPYSVVVRSTTALSPQNLRLVRLWKPAGLILHIVDSVDFLYFDLASTGMTYDELAAAYTTYDDIDWP